MNKLMDYLRERIPVTPIQRGLNEVEREPVKIKSKRLPRGPQLKNTLPHAILRHLYETSVCAICGDKDPKRNLAIDHCHESGTLRGMLCLRCNAGIGQFRDNPELLRKAAQYLEADKSFEDELHSRGLAFSLLAKPQVGNPLDRLK